MRARKLGLTEADVDEMVRLWNQGYNCAEIGKRFDCLSGSVHARLVKRGVTVGTRHRAKLTRQSNGYWRFGSNYVHRIVAEAWYGRKLRTDEHVHHLDGDKTNNHPENLQILTHSQHMRLHGAEAERWTRDDDRTLLRMHYRFTLPQPPSANRWWRNVDGRMVTSKEARAYKSTAFTKALAQGVRQIRRPARVSVALTWYRGRKSGDLDKRLGILLDSLQSVAFENDSQVVEIHAHRTDAEPTRPRVEIEIREL